MGGIGSGRSGGQPTIESCGSIVFDVAKLLSRRKGRMMFGAKLRGQRGGPFEIRVLVRLDPTGTGEITINHDAFDHLSGSVPAADYTIEMAGRPWQFGGQRWFAICPRSGRYVSKLHLPNGATRFAGREAYGLAYRSQRVDAIQQGHLRQTRAYAKLGAEYRTFRQSIPVKPKWMRMRTYARCVAGIKAAQAEHRENYAALLMRVAK